MDTKLIPQYILDQNSLKYTKIKKKKPFKIDFSNLFAESHGEPVEDFNYRHKADSEAESTNATDVGDEVQPSHLPRSLKLWISTHESQILME